MSRRLFAAAIALAAVALSPVATSRAEAHAPGHATASALGMVSIWTEWCFPDEPDADCVGVPAPQPRHIHGPVSPTCGVRLCDTNGEVKWIFSAPTDPTIPANCTLSLATAGSGPCTVRARGTLANTGAPAWCGFNQGEINRIFLTTGSHTERLSGSGLALNPGPYAMAWRITDFSSVNTDRGIATITLLDAPECGLNPATGFAGEHSFAAQLTLTWTKAS